MINHYSSYFYLLFIGVSILCAACSTLQSGKSKTGSEAMQTVSIVPPDGWKLKWNDEFNDSEIDLAKWTYDIGAGGWGNGEGEFYTSRKENARTENGTLVIEARTEKYEDSYYTSARLKTQGLQDFQYGRIEAKIKVPKGKGLWPAFWLLGSSFNNTIGSGSNWPTCGEIDIMEYIGKEPDLILGTIHGPGYSGALGFTKWNRQDYEIADEFHTYAIEWEPGKITWFYDNQSYFTVNKSDIGDREWVFDQPFFLIINLAVGGQFPGAVGLDTNFPAQLLIDYIRVFERLE